MPGPLLLFARPRAPLALLAGLCLALTACQSPVRAVRVDREDAHRELTRSAVTTGDPSWPTRDALFERGLFERFEDEPEAVIAELHRAMVAGGGDPDLMFALSEISFLHGHDSGRRDYQLAAAIYAYAFLFPESDAPRPGPFDPRFRLAADLYNWGLTAALSSDDGDVVPRGGTFELPFGPITVSFDPDDLRVGKREMHRFVPVAELEVHGLAMRYRWPGIGAPLAASVRPIEEGEPENDLIAPRLQVPVTALLRIAGARRALAEGRPLEAALELHLAWDDDVVEIAGEEVPLEVEPTAALAYTFTGLPVVRLEILTFLGRVTGLAEGRKPLVSTTPYRPGMVPVVFVHGTASSVIRWAELYNRLHADPEIRGRYQFWFFTYDSNQPIALSSLQLREALTTAVARLDPQGTDPALRRMVLIGHSQGGLLVKMQAIDTGDRLWNGVAKKPLDELRLTDSNRDLIRRAMFVEPLPEVSRVIFMATPHRGSFLAASTFVTNTLRRLTNLPFQLTALSLDVARNLDATRSPLRPTAVDNMSPGHPFIRALQQIPVDPSITAHSIIAVDTDGAFEEGNDGVVEYASAHIQGVESELVVHSPHSCQGAPEAMEEVRRILRLHAGVGGGEPGSIPDVSEQPAS